MTDLPNDPFVQRLTDVLITQRLQELQLQVADHLDDLVLHPDDLTGERASFIKSATVELPGSSASRFRDLPGTFLEHLDANVMAMYRAVLVASSAEKPASISASTVLKIAAQSPHLYINHDLSTSVAADLQNQPHLQAKVSALTYYTPSKWLLEQEMLSRTSPGEPVLPGPAPTNWPADRGDVYDYAARQSLIGLCFSGGGVRSATFNLGMLQALAELDLLKHFDYLSSVSGGGYIHQWFAAWIKRSSDLEHVRKQLIAQPQENCTPASAEPIRWLRRYASYLTPNRGLFSADLWVVVAIWFRNTLLNQIVLFTILGMLFAVPHLLVGGFEFKVTTPPPVRLHVAAPPDSWYQTHHFWLSSFFHFVLHHLARLSDHPYLYAGNALACLVFLWVSRKIAHNFDLMRQGTETEDHLNGLMTEAKVRLQLVLPLLLCSVWLAFWLQPIPAGESTRSTWVVIAILFSFMNVRQAFAGGFLACIRCRQQPQVECPPGLRATLVPSVLISLAAVASAIAATTMVPLVHSGAIWFFVHAQLLPAELGQVVKTSSSWRLNFVLLPPLYLSAPYFGIILLGGFLGADYPEACREWLARFRAWNMLVAGMWILLTGSALLGPYIGAWLLHKTPRTAIIGFIVAHVTTLVTGSSSQSDGKRLPTRFFGMKPMDALAWIASPIAIAGLLIAFSSAVEKIGIVLQRNLQGHGLPAFIWATGAIVLACLIVQGTLGMRIDVNTFSMHAFYRNRLARCYLGATNPDRRPDPFTGFDHNGELADPETSPGTASNGDDHTVKDSRKALYMRNLLPQNWRPLATLDLSKRENQKPYDGPFPIFCSTINLTFGQELAWQERKGASFAFTPLYSGYHVGWTAARSNENLSFNGYTPTDHYTSGRGVPLDTAAAISGAAMNPNQGYNTMPAVAFLMTLFNVRLGWWIWNPRNRVRVRTWPLFPWKKITRPSPVCAMSSLVRELLTKVDDTSKFVLLTDGGHFENMGLYELVRRRCRYIVISDAEEDESMQFEGIGKAIRNCRLDFGAEIDLDLRPLQLQKDTSLSQMHCVVGTITYPPASPPVPVAAGAATMQHQTDAPDYTGIIVYIKSSLTGDESGDLLSYKNANAAFPQDSTANQRFTESQFESYRRLGHHVGITTFQPAKVGVYDHGSIGSMFENLLQIWYPPAPELQAHSAENTAHVEKLLSELRSIIELDGLAEVLFARRLEPPQIKKWKAASKVSEDYALQFGNSLIDFMNVVYNNLQLAFLDNRTSPHAKGWIALFEKWCNTSLIQDAWKKFGDTYPQEFKLFAEHVLSIVGNKR